MAGGWGGTRQTVPRSTCAKHGRSGGDEDEKEKTKGLNQSTCGRQKRCKHAAFTKKNSLI